MQCEYCLEVPILGNFDLFRLRNSLTQADALKAQEKIRIFNLLFDLNKTAGVQIKTSRIVIRFNCDYALKLPKQMKC